MRLDRVRGFVLDIDGTLLHRAGERLVLQPGAAELLTRIKASGRPFVLFTNGSHDSPAGIAGPLREAGLPVEDGEVLTPLCSAQTYLGKRSPDGSLMLIGTAESRVHLQRSGVRLADADDDTTPFAVFVAAPDEIDFPTLERAARAVLGGARLLTGSYVRSYAGADGPIFSHGGMTTAAIVKATGARPVVVGKPSRAAVETFSDRLGHPPQEVVVIGDDASVDIVLGHMGGSRTILVRTGTTGAASVDRLPQRHRPDDVVDDVSELVERL